MNHFDYRAGVLHAEDVSLPALAAEVGTPFYCYATATLARHIRVFREAFAGGHIVNARHIPLERTSMMVAPLLISCTAIEAGTFVTPWDLSLSS